MKQFIKNDSGFICKNCGAQVCALKYSSRDHCTNCLCSLHIDINPGDRQNTCKGLMKPIDITYKNGEYIIHYMCTKCGQQHNNKSATDDNFETILSVMNKTYGKK